MHFQTFSGILRAAVTVSARHSRHASILSETILNDSLIPPFNRLHEDLTYITWFQAISVRDGFFNPGTPVYNRLTSYSDGNKLCARPPQFARPCKLTFDLLTLKVVPESHVTWATSAPILVFLSLCSRLRPDVRDRQTDVVRRQTSDAHHRLMPPTLRAGHNKEWSEHSSPTLCKVICRVLDIFSALSSIATVQSKIMKHVKAEQHGMIDLQFRSDHKYCNKTYWSLQSKEHPYNRRSAALNSREWHRKEVKAPFLTFVNPALSAEPSLNTSKSGPAYTVVLSSFCNCRWNMLNVL